MYLPGSGAPPTVMADRATVWVSGTPRRFAVASVGASGPTLLTPSGSRSLAETLRALGAG